jgi:ketosteroid isomerase-like protein
VSQENVEVVRRAFVAWNAGDLEGVGDLLTAETEFIPLRSQLEGAAYQGPEGMRQFARDAAEEWEFLRISPDEFHDLGDRVLLLGHFDAQARGSGMHIRFPVGWVARLSGGKIVHLRTYSDQQEALEAVGLREQA